ncbi:MAG: hypothetical protein QY331_02335 [Melioribacteraceae bacterium]|nr:MAG: hypothetical protein QY331_02335 [Melioribacteraceae bacterium]
MRKGDSLLEHKVEGAITLFLLFGNLNFAVRDTKTRIKSNSMIVLDRAIFHDVEAPDDSSFALTIVQL